VLPEARIAPPEVRDLRQLLRHRAGLIALRTRLKVRVRAVLGERGIAGPAALWTGPGHRRLVELELPPTQRLVVDNVCRLLGEEERWRKTWSARSRGVPDPTSGQGH
jgi:hypothetical protein